MELYIYDRNLEMVGIIDTASDVIWHRRYFTSGDFEIHTPATDITLELIKKQYIIKKSDSVEFGIIESLILEQREDGEYIKASGRFGSSLLGRRIIMERTTLNTTVEEAMRELVYNNAIDISGLLLFSDTLLFSDDLLFVANRSIPKLELGDVNGYTEEVSFQVTYKNLLVKLEELAKTSGISYRIRFDDINKKFIFETYKALDRSAAQSVNPRAIFSNDYETLLTSTYQTTDQQHSNVVLVGGEGEDELRKLVTLGGDEGLDRYEVFVDAKDIRMEDGMTLEEYNALLSQKGYESLIPVSEWFEGNVISNGNLIYKTDYDLGDIVTIENSKWGIRINVRITEITEVYDANGVTIVPIFGSTLPLISDIISIVRSV